MYMSLREMTKINSLSSACYTQYRTYRVVIWLVSYARSTRSLQYTGKYYKRTGFPFLLLLRLQLVKIDIFHGFTSIADPLVFLQKHIVRSKLGCLYYIA